MSIAHLTADQRKALADMFASCDTAEFLRCVSGLVQHRIADMTVALDAGEAIRRVANDIAKHERAAHTVVRLPAGWHVYGPDGRLLEVVDYLHRATAKYPGATIAVD